MAAAVIVLVKVPRWCLLCICRLPVTCIAAIACIIRIVSIVTDSTSPGLWHFHTKLSPTLLIVVALVVAGVLLPLVLRVLFSFFF